MPPETSLLLRRVRPIACGTAPTKAPYDVLIDPEGRVAAVGTELPAPAGVETHDFAGAYLSPGWVDLHTHIYYGATDISVRARTIGAATGVATLVDAGSAGEANFHGFREYVAEPSRERIFAYLNIGSIGLVACNRVSELIDARSIDVDRTLDCIDAHRDLIRGIKVRASGVIVGAWGIAPMKIARQVARVAGLPLMVHIGETPPAPDEVFALLEPGDVVTHCFHGKRGTNILEDEALFAAARLLADRGVVLDIGHGAASFSYKVGKAALDRGLYPATISSDLHNQNIDGPVWDLSLVMSKFLALGLSVEEVVERVTVNALRALRELADGFLAAGAPARFTLFDVADADLSLPDAMGNELHLTRCFAPRGTVLGRTLVPAASRRT